MMPMPLVRFRRWPVPAARGALLVVAGVVLGLTVARAEERAPAEASDSAEHRFFRERIEPVLKSRCYGCHSAAADEIQGSLRLDSQPGLLRGGDSGPAVIAGKPAESLLIQALRHDNGYAMPPEQDRLAAATIADFVRWVEMGAPDPRNTEPALVDRLAQGREHWAFQPVERPAVPAPSASHDARWPAFSPIDAFIHAPLRERNWHPAPPASRSEWIRRVTFDLTGLPPTPEEIAAFERDTSGTAYEGVVDRLLASHRYGERAAQHWLDVVRFAETEGYEYDAHLPDAWRYRDYVINAFNADKPFDRFVMEQIAGDELAPGNLEYQTAAIFHRLGPVRRNAGNPDIALSRNEVLTERTDIIGAAFLGLTLGCARCHNHKLEPITQRDYYCLQAYLAATDEHNLILAPDEERQAWEQTTAQLKSQMTALREKAALGTPAEKIRLEREIAAIEDRMPAPLPTIPTTRNHESARTEIHVLQRGIWENKGEAVGPRPPSVLVPEDFAELPADTASPRTSLAQWLASPQNPLTARVIVNRVWQQHFGRGLVATANDFGTHGSRPSLPALLDWLAAELIANGWRLKPLHREIVLSAAYRQASRSACREAAANDPDNRLLWHVPRRRLSAEEIRDSLLVVSGRLNAKALGPSVMVPVDAELVGLLYKPSQWKVASDPSEHDRRSIYLLAKRNLRLPFLEVFDGPALLTSCARRESSTHAPQALELLNGTLSNELALAFAQRLREECGDDPAEQIERGFVLALGRSPRRAERTLSEEFLASQPLEEFALALFNLNEFLYVP